MNIKFYFMPFSMKLVDIIKTFVNIFILNYILKLKENTTRTGKKKFWLSEEQHENYKSKQYKYWSKKIAD